MKSPVSPVTSSLAAQPALPRALLEAGTAQGEEKSSKQPWKGPGPVTNPCALRHAAQGTNVAPQIQLPVRPCPAEGLQSLPEPSSLAGICSALIQFQHVRCCVGRETDSAQGKPTFGVGQCWGMPACRETLSTHTHRAGGEVRAIPSPSEHSRQT